METMMSWGAEEWQGARPGQVRGGEEVDFAEKSLLGRWFSPTRLKSSLRTREGARPARKKLPAIDRQCWAAGLSREKVAASLKMLEHGVVVWVERLGGCCPLCIPSVAWLTSELIALTVFLFPPLDH